MSERVDEVVEVHPLNMEVYEDFAESMRAAYPQWSGALWKKETISRLLNLFPDGQLGVFVNGRLVGCALSIIVDIDKIGLDHDYRKVTGDRTFNTHTEKGIPCTGSRFSCTRSTGHGDWDAGCTKRARRSVNG